MIYVERGIGLLFSENLVCCKRNYRGNQKQTDFKTTCIYDEQVLGSMPIPKKGHQHIQANWMCLNRLAVVFLKPPYQQGEYPAHRSPFRQNPLTGTIKGVSTEIGKWHHVLGTEAAAEKLTICT